MLTLPVHKLAVLMALVLLGCAGATPRAQPAAEEVKTTQAEAVPWRVGTVKDPYLFTTAQGLRVEILPIESTVDATLIDRYLLRIRGTQDDLDGVVLLARVVKHGTFRTVIRGQPKYLIYREHLLNPSATNLSGWYYRKDESYNGSISLDAGDANEVDGEALLERYAKQAASGLNEKLNPTGRAKRERLQQAALDRFLGHEDRQACGRLTMSIDWSTVEDEWFEDMSIASECSADLVYLNAFCTRFPNRVPEVSALSPLRCAFSGHPDEGAYIPPQITKAGGLLFVPRDRRDVGAATSFHFRKLFGEQAQVLRGKKVYFIARDEQSKTRALYNGDGKTFYPNGTLSENDGFSERILNDNTKQAALIRDGGAWLLECDRKREKLQFLEGKERDAILAAATFEDKPKWQREPYFLARDTRGTYYYVDRVRKDYGGRRYRVFTGRRGQLKLSKLKGVVDDSVGTVFSTEKGELRLVVAINSQDPTAIWIRGKKKSVLTSVNVFTNKSLIYDELGAYFGEDLGHVCTE